MTLFRRPALCLPGGGLRFFMITKEGGHVHAID